MIIKKKKKINYQVTVDHRTVILLYDKKTNKKKTSITFIADTFEGYYPPDEVEGI